MKKMFKSLVALSLAATMLAGCSGGSSSTTAATVATTAGSSTETTAAENVKYKEQVVIAINNSIAHANPYKTENTQHNMLFASMYNTLVSLNKETMEIEPELATEWEWVDDLTLEMKLRDDVTFHDGSPMTAEDVVFSFSTCKELGTITGMEVLDKIEAIDDHSVRMTMVSKNADWLYRISVPVFSIVSKSACEADPENGYSIGTGPWKLDKMVASDYVDLVRYDGYWGELPKTKELSIRTITEGSARVIALQNGEADICLSVPSTEIGFVADDPNLETVQYASSTCIYLAIDSSEAPGEDINLRRALAHCLNIDDIITVAADGKGTKATSYWGPNTFGYYDGIEPYEQNLELAKEYLDKAYPNGGAKLKITVNGGSYKKAAEVVQEQARAIGLEIEIEELESATMTATSKFNDPQHEAMIYALSWKTYGDDCRRPYYVNSNTNKAVIKDEHVHELVDLGVSEFDETKRKEYYKEIQELNHENVWFIPLYYSTSTHGVNKNLTGAYFSTDNNHDFSYAAVAE